MSEFPESFRELLQSPGVCVLSTLEPDGGPQTSAVWYLLDDDDKLKMSLNGTRRKVQNMLRDNKVSVIFVDPENPYRNLELRGTADLTVDEDGSFRDKLGAKYGQDVSVHDKPGDTRYVVTVEPARVRVWPPGA
jgi:PPOX class probable F420-dependent enzyme